MNPSHSQFMLRAIELARRGEGRVEPNPLVGCVVVRDGEVVGEGWHQKFGGDHAEVEALKAAGENARGADLYVTLEPCCHEGKTPPCTKAVIAAGVRRVIIGCQDPNPTVSGGGMAELEAAGMEVRLDDPEGQASRLIAPFEKLMRHRQPWVIAKWAMTLDGKLATHTGDSQWISGEASRQVVHQLRGRVDAILVGRGTAELDNPLLTARPAGPRTATRIVLDSSAWLSLESRLVQSVEEAPLLVVVTSTAPRDRMVRLQDAGCEVLVLPEVRPAQRLAALFDELGQRQMTNLLVEGGNQVFGQLFDQGAVDEVHAFIAPKIVGGDEAPSAVGGTGIEQMAAALQLANVTVETLEGDIHCHGFVQRAK